MLNSKMSIPNLLLLATENRGKVVEMTDVLSRALPNTVKLISLSDLSIPFQLPEEVGDTFQEIAIAKATQSMRATGLPSIGDDSGLCVNALGGLPGVKSRRWAGSDLDDAGRNRALLDLLNETYESRSASFVTAMAIVLPDCAPVVATGECSGQITRSPRGSNGFGYDPIFEVSGYHRTMAELTSTEKNRISHRARALQNLLFALGWTSTEFTD